MVKQGSVLMQLEVSGSVIAFAFDEIDRAAKVSPATKKPGICFVIMTYSPFVNIGEGDNYLHNRKNGRTRKSDTTSKAMPRRFRRVPETQCNLRRHLRISSKVCGINAIYMRYSCNGDGGSAGIILGRVIVIPFVVPAPENLEPL